MECIHGDQVCGRLLKGNRNYALSIFSIVGIEFVHIELIRIEFGALACPEGRGRCKAAREGPR